MSKEETENKVSFINKAKNLIKETTNHVLNGAQNVSREEYLRRAMVCDSCVHFVKKDNICGVCGCYMDVKAKWKVSDCPKNKW
jgi:hypothetical protein